MRIRLIFAVGTTLVAGLLYYTPLDLRDGRDLPNHGLPAYQAASYRPVETHTAPTTTTVAPTTTTTLPAAPQGARCPQWWHLAQLAGWSWDELAQAVDLIMWRESRCDPTARSATRDSGLMQINDIHLPALEAVGITREMLLDPWWNLIASRMVSDLAVSYGWSPFQPWSATYP
jgi:hypothetical protein